MQIEYARAPGGWVGYSTVGEGPLTILLSDNHVTNLEVMWEQPLIERFHRRIGSFARLVLFDHRGTGVSDPIPQAELTAEPTIEVAVEDTLAVLDALGLERASILGVDTGGFIAMQLAAMAPHRVDRLVLCDPIAKVVATEDYPWGMPQYALERFVEAIETTYGRGGGATFSILAPQLAEERPDLLPWAARYERLACPPGVQRSFWANAGDVDLRPLLGSIQAPTLVIEHSEGVWRRHPGRDVAASIPGAQFVEVEGRNTSLWAPQPDELMAEIEAFFTGARSQGAEPEPERVLTTVVFTDIVESTRAAQAHGDRAWRDLLDRHDTVADDVVGRFRGNLVQHTGDGVLVSFDGPARAVRCSDALRTAIHDLGLDIRASVHTGEVETRGHGLSGIGVHVAARVLSLCEPTEILVTRTVKDLVMGSGIRFTDRGSHELKGVDEPWQVFSVSAT